MGGQTPKRSYWRWKPNSICYSPRCVWKDYTNLCYDIIGILCRFCILHYERHLIVLCQGKHCIYHGSSLEFIIRLIHRRCHPRVVSLILYRPCHSLNLISLVHLFMHAGVWELLKALCDFDKSHNGCMVFHNLVLSIQRRREGMFRWELSVSFWNGYWA